MCCDASDVCVQGQEGVLSQAKNDINTTSHQIESKVCKLSDVEKQADSTEQRVSGLNTNLGPTNCIKSHMNSGL